MPASKAGPAATRLAATPLQRPPQVTLGPREEQGQRLVHLLTSQCPALGPGTKQMLVNERSAE